MSEANPIVTLKAKIKEFGFSKLKAGESNKSANSDETMYFDFPRKKFLRKCLNMLKQKFRVTLF